MNRSRIEILAHPIRLRIVGAFSKARATVEEIKRMLPDVPQATLYRQVQLLIDEGVLRIVGHHRARGGPQRILSLAEGGGLIPDSEWNSANAAELERILTAFIASMLGNARTYLGFSGNRGPDPGVACRGQVFFATDAEACELRDRVHRLLAEAADRPQLFGARRWRASFFSVPIEPAGRAA